MKLMATGLPQISLTSLLVRVHDVVGQVSSPGDEVIESPDIVKRLTPKSGEKFRLSHLRNFGHCERLCFLVPCQRGAYTLGFTDGKPRLLNGHVWGFPRAAVEHIETHAAHVFLCGDRFQNQEGCKIPLSRFLHG